jgi:hypothetical protein
MEGFPFFGFPNMISGVNLTVCKRLSGGTFGTFVFYAFEGFETVLTLRVAQGIPESCFLRLDWKNNINI